MKRIVKITKPIQDNVVQTFRVLLEEEAPIKVLYEESRPYLTYQIVVDTDLNESSELYKTAMEKDIFEVPLKGELSQVFKLLFEMFHLVNSKGMFISHILVGSIKTFSKWLKQDVKQIFNIKLTEVDELEEDVVLFIASTRQQAEIEDFRFVVKGNIDV